MAVDAFIWFEEPGVLGESPSAPPEHIEIESFSFGTSSSATGGAGAGKATVLDFVKTSAIDHSTPYLTYRLENVFVSSFQIGGGEGMPIESLSLNFGLIHIPRIGQELIVSFEEGDPDQPIVVGSVVGDFDGNRVPYVLTAAELGAGEANFPVCATGEHIGHAELSISSIGQPPPPPLGQLAVNIVDYIDEDEISSPFHFVNQLSNGAGEPAGSQASPYFVFGTELPAIVLNEALAQFHLVSSPEYFASNFAHPGGENVAAGDVNGDGIADIITGEATGTISGSGDNFVVELKNVLISSYQVQGGSSADNVFLDPRLSSQEFFQVVGAADDASNAVAPMFCVQYRETDFNFSIYLVTPGPDDTVEQPPQPVNKPPVVSAGDDANLVEGQAFSRFAAFTDDYSLGPWTGTVDYGDGSGEQPLMLNADKSFALNHLYTDDGTYPVTVRVTDEQGLVGTDTLTVTAQNALPHIGGAAIAPSLERQEATLQVTVDPTNPHDELTLTIDWGDGTAPQMFACPSDPSVLSFSHRYAHDGAFTVKLSLADDDGSVDTFSILANVQNVDIIVVGSDAGAPLHVKVFDANTHKLKFDLSPYQSKFLGGVRVAAGDVNGDGIPDIIAAPGMGGAPQVKVFDGMTGQLVRSFFGFEKTFLGGIYVAAGDVNGDGRADIVLGRGRGNSQVRVFSGANGSLLSSFLAYPGFGGGVYVAAGDVNGDGRSDVITGAGPGAGPHVKVFDGASAALLSSFFAYAPNFQGGCFVAAGDVNGDGKDDIITGAGKGGSPHVKVFDAATLQAIDSFFAYDPSFHGGVRVAAGDVNGDGIADIITGAGNGAAQKVRTFDGLSLAALDSFFALDPRTSKGFFVAGSR